MIKGYGKELILDLHHCDVSLFNRECLKKYFVQLCDLIKMEREALHWWDYKGQPEEYEKAPVHLKGISAIQFIKTSNITIHTLDIMKNIYLNIFSCKDCDCEIVAEFTRKYCNGEVVAHTIVERL